MDYRVWDRKLGRMKWTVGYMVLWTLTGQRQVEVAALWRDEKIVSPY